MIAVMKKRKYRKKGKLEKSERLTSGKSYVWSWETRRKSKTTGFPGWW